MFLPKPSKSVERLNVKDKKISIGNNLQSKHRFSSTQLRLRSEYAYHPRSSPMSPQHLRTKSCSAANYLRRTITSARRTNIMGSVAKTRLTVSFYIHRETPIPLDHARTRKNVVFHIDIYNGMTLQRFIIFFISEEVEVYEWIKFNCWSNIYSLFSNLTRNASNPNK